MSTAAYSSFKYLENIKYMFMSTYNLLKPPWKSKRVEN